MSVAAPQDPKPGRSWKQYLTARARRIYLIFAGVFFAAALVWGGLATYAALDLNPQGVFCDSSRFDGRGLSAWLGFDCDLQWRSLGTFVLIAAGIGSVPMIAYLAFLAGRTVWRLFRGAASGKS